MSENECAPPAPSPEHEKLQQNVGLWKVDCTFFMGPDQPPMQCEAREAIDSLGPFWTVSLFEMEMMGAPFQGRATTGYDPKAGVWRGTWVDSMSPHLFNMSGNYDDAGKILTMTCEGPSMMTGEMTTFRSTYETLENDQRKFEMFQTGPDGSEFPMMSYIYTRIE